MNNRVYNDKVNVDDKSIKAFFNNRLIRINATNSSIEAAWMGGRKPVSSV